ncbi:DUF5719 family protein [Streptomyces sp. B6B3]|uniref:DUF5719 family protein n=1 Tax=Streptomyces sp. B6B3 TaxID=3153570 RepID=UPI00325E6C6D
MNRPTISLLAVGGALLALTGVASLGPGDGSADSTTPAAASPRPVERTTLTCPRPTEAESATTWYTGYTPAGESASDQEAGSANLFPAPEYVPGTEDPADDGEDSDEGGGDQGGGGEGGDGAGEEAEPVAALEEPGLPVTVSTERSDAPALFGTAEEALAPGWTVQQTTSVATGAGRGLLGTTCQEPDTAFWFAGASTAETRHDYVHVINPDAAATVVDIELYGPEGRLETDAGQAITVPGGSALPVRLSTLTDEELDDLAVQVTARTGRVGAQVEVVDEELGADWLPPAAVADGPLVLPGIPADATDVRLVAYAPGDEDVTFDVGLAGPSGVITPAGNETVAVRSGELTVLELGNLSQGEAGSLVLTPASGSGGGPVAAAVAITAAAHDEDGEATGAEELAFVPASASIEQRGSIAGNTADGTGLALTATRGPVEVEVTVSAGSDGGEPFTENHTVDAGTTLAIAPEIPDGTKGRYAITVERVGGDGRLYAARTLSEGGGEQDLMLTVQPFADDRSTVAVPATEEDLAVLTD